MAPARPNIEPSLHPRKAILAETQRNVVVGAGNPGPDWSLQLKASRSGLVDAAAYVLNLTRSAVTSLR